MLAFVSSDLRVGKTQSGHLGHGGIRAGSCACQVWVIGGSPMDHARVMGGSGLGQSWVTRGAFLDHDVEHDTDQD